MRDLRVIVREIEADWKTPYFGAIPYLNAMAMIRQIDDRFGFDNGYTVVMYFLANANTWKGETARRIKLELNKMLKS